VRRLTEQPPVTTIIQKRRLMLFGHLIRVDESTDARRILIAVPQSEWRRPVGRPYTSWMATLKNDLALHNLTLEDVLELALNKLLWRLLAACGATHWWCMPNNDDDCTYAVGKNNVPTVHTVARWRSIVVTGQNQIPAVQRGLKLFLFLVFLTPHSPWHNYDILPPGRR